MRALPHTPAGGTTRRPPAGHRHPAGVRWPGPSPARTEGCARLTPGRPPPHQGGGESPSDTRARRSASHARATRVTLPTSVPGAPRIPHLSRARAAAAPPPADPSGGPSRALDTAQLPRRSHRAQVRGPARRTASPFTSSPPQGSARRHLRDRHLHPGLPKAPIH